MIMTTYCHCGIQIELANNHKLTIRFTVEVSETETTFLDTCIYKAERLKKRKESIVDVLHTSNRRRLQYQYTHFSLSPLRGSQERFIKGEALRLFRTNSSEETFEENINNFKR